MTTVRVGASMAKNVKEVLNWLSKNVGEFHYMKQSTHNTKYYGENWEASWRQYAAGWFMDVTFDDPKHATFFTLRWK